MDKAKNRLVGDFLERLEMLAEDARADQTAMKEAAKEFGGGVDGSTKFAFVCEVEQCARTLVNLAEGRHTYNLSSKKSV